MQLSFGSTPNMAPGQVSFGGDAGDIDANVQPSTTTIKTNSDGSRDVTHKTSYTADQAPQSGFSFNSSNNNAAPTAPVAPQQGQLGSGTGMGIMPEAAPVAPAAPAQTFGQTAQPTTQSIPQVPEPGPGVQVAGPMVAGAAGGAPQPQPQPQAAPAPVAPTQLAPPAAGASAEGNAGEAQAQAAQSTGQANPYAIMQNDPAVADQVRQQHMDILNNNSDIRVAAAKSGDTNLPMDVRHMFAMQTADLSRYNMEQQKAKEKVATMTPSEISRVLQKDHPDGSWTRYLITGILGLTGLNQMEANKLGLGDKTMPVRDPTTGASGMIRVSPDGTPTMGINSDGTMMDHKELTNFYTQATQKKVAAAKPGSEYLGPNGEKGRMVTVHQPDGKTDTYIESNGERVSKEQALNWKQASLVNAGVKSEKTTEETIKRQANQTIEMGNRKETGAQITETHAGATGFNRAAGSAAGRLGTEMGTTVPFAQQHTGAVVNSPPVSGNAPSPVAPGAQATAPGINVPPPVAPGAQATAPGINVPPPGASTSTGANVGPLPTAMPSQANVPGTPPAYNSALSPMQNKEILKNWTAENKKILTDFSPGGAAGKQIVAITTATNHIMDDFEPMVKRLKLGQYPTANEIQQKLTTWSGGNDYTNINLIGHAMADEISKTLTSGGPGALADRQAMEEKFRSAQGVDQLTGALENAKRLMAGKTETLEQQYARSGRRDFYTNVVSDPRVKTVVDRIRAERNVRSGQAPQGTIRVGAHWKEVQ